MKRYTSEQVKIALDTYLDAVSKAPICVQKVSF